MFRKKTERQLTLTEFTIEGGNIKCLLKTEDDDEYSFFDLWSLPPENYSFMMNILKSGCRKNKVKLIIDMTPLMKKKIKKLLKEGGE